MAKIYKNQRCLKCGKIYDGRGAKFCSAMCARVARQDEKENKICLYCGKEYQGRGTKFCSPMCSHLALKDIKAKKENRVGESYFHSAHEYYTHLKEFGKGIPTISRKSIQHNTGKESLCILISDTHIGKEVIDSITNKVIFDSKIGRKRLNIFTKKLVGLADKVIIKHEIDEIVIFLAGDLVEGDSAYESIKSHIDIEPTLQADTMARVIWGILINLHKLFPKVKLIRLVCIPGNHGLVSRHTAEINNWDNVIHLQIKHLLDITKIKWAKMEYTTQDILVTEVKGHKILLIHKAPKNFDSSGARNKYLGWIDSYKPNLILTAHWHHAGLSELTDKCLVICNPSLVGADSLAVRLGLSSQPRQWVFGITKKRIPTFMYLVDLKEELQ